MNKKTLTRADLSESLHRSIGLSRTESADMVNSVLDLVAEALVDGQSVKLSSFGTFMIRAKRERMGRNPKTGEKVQVPKKYVPHFKAGKELRERVDLIDATTDITKPGE